MIKITASIHFWGESFLPGKAEQLTGLVFTEQIEVGDTAKTGRYKNKPTPYGAASFNAPNEIEGPDRILWLAHQWSGRIELAKQCGAEEIHFWVGYFYDDQCNCDLSVEAIKAINALSIPYLFSVYQVDDLNTIS
ncbi:hypothetical protein [Spirosoma arcticum]